MIDKSKLTLSQLDCLERKGQCSDRCTGWMPAKRGCAVRDADPIASELGRPALIDNHETRKRTQAPAKQQQECKGTEHKCQECGAIYSSRSALSKYCSRGCKRAVAKRQWAKASAKRTAAKNGGIERKPKPLAEVRQCAWQGCKRDFIPKSGAQRYCGSACQQEAQREQIAEANRRRSEERTKKEKATSKILECMECRKPVEVSRATMRVLCPECKAKRHRERCNTYYHAHKAKQVAS